MPPAPTPTTQTRSTLERERLVSLINSMADGVIATSDGALVDLYNGAALNILDINTAAQGKPISAICKLVDKSDKPVDVKKLVLETTSPVSRRDLSLVYGDGNKINLYISIAPVRLGFGHQGTSGHVILLRDITQEKSLEEERDEFISVVSHELRTPIAITEGNVNNAQLILEKTKDLTKVGDALAKAHDQVLFLGSLVNDLATLSRAERGKQTVELEPVNAHDLISSLTQGYDPVVAAKNLTLTTELDPKLELITTSRLYLQEVLQNFITNAIKYTEKGGITVSAQQRESGILFKVSDTGIGISPKDQDQLFNKFFRSDDPRTHMAKGTGLGLYVTAKLAKLISANITLESELNKGSVFSIFVPNLS